MHAVVGAIGVVGLMAGMSSAWARASGKMSPGADRLHLRSLAAACLACRSTGRRAIERQARVGWLADFAACFKREKLRSKVLILARNPDVTSKGPRYKKSWSEIHGNMLERRSQHTARPVDVRSRTFEFEIHDDFKADVLKMLPPLRAGDIAVQAGLTEVNMRAAPGVDHRPISTY